MSQKEVYEFNVPTFGKGVVFDVGHQERAEQFRFFSEALKTARLQTYVQLMVQEAEAFFAERLKGSSGQVRRPPPCTPQARSQLARARWTCVTC
jgi:sterol 14-demethylase